MLRREALADIEAAILHAVYAFWASEAYVAKRWPETAPFQWKTGLQDYKRGYLWGRYRARAAGTYMGKARTALFRALDNAKEIS